MNIEDARKIIADHEAGKCEECFEGACMDEAKGFIQGYESGRREALESEAVKELIEEYVHHTDYCILSFWEGGEPTEGGGYRSKFKGKWYQSKPIDETPKCNCGLDEILSRFEQFKNGASRA